MAQTVILAWFLLVALIQNHVEASSMEEVCNVTGMDFLVCMECLTGHESNSGQTIAGEDENWGGKAIKCARRYVDIGRNALVAYSNNSTGKLKDASGFCIPKLISAAGEYQEAIEFWSYLKKDFTVNAITEGLNYFHECAVKIVWTGLPRELLSLLTHVRAHGSNALAIIKSINV